MARNLIGMFFILVLASTLFAAEIEYSTDTQFKTENELTVSLKHIGSPECSSTWCYPMYYVKYPKSIKPEKAVLSVNDIKMKKGTIVDQITVYPIIALQNITKITPSIKFIEVEKEILVEGSSEQTKSIFETDENGETVERLVHTRQPINTTKMSIERQISYENISTSMIKGTYIEANSFDNTKYEEYYIKLKIPFTDMNKGDQFNITVGGKTADPDVGACSFVASTANDNYTLSADIACTGTNGVNITAANVTLDCGGYRIGGNNAITTYGVAITGTNATVKNCVISGFQHQIYISQINANVFNNTLNQSYNGGNGIYSTANGASILNNTINAFTGSNGIQHERANALIQNNTINANTSLQNTVGIYFVFSNADYNRINANTIYTKASSITLEAGAMGNNFTNNVLYNQISGAAVTFTGATNNDNLFLNNSISANITAISIPATTGLRNTIDCAGLTYRGNNLTGAGISLYDINNTIQNCIITNFGNGIVLNAAHNTTVINTSSNSSRALGGGEGYGIQVAAANSIKVYNSTFEGEGSFGVRFDTSTYATFSNVTAKGGAYEAIVLNSNSNYNTFLNTTIIGKSRYGLYNSGSSHNTYIGINSNFVANTSGQIAIYSIDGTGVNNTFDCAGGILNGTRATGSTGIINAHSSVIKNCNIQNYLSGILIRGVGKSTVDCEGAWINGTNGTTQIGIAVNTSVNNISNCNIIDFFNGVKIYSNTAGLNGSFTKLENITAIVRQNTNSGNPIYILATNDSTLINVTAINNASTATTAVGINLLGANNTYIYNSTATSISSGASSAGILLTSSNNNSLIGVQTNQTGSRSALKFITSSWNNVSNSQIFNPSGEPATSLAANCNHNKFINFSSISTAHYAIQVSSNNNSFANSNFTTSTAQAYRVLAHNNTATNISAYSYSSYACYIETGNHNIIENSYCRGNSTDWGALMVYNDANHNVIKNNVVDGTDGKAILLYAGVNNTIQNNTVSSGTYGIYLDSTNNINNITDNTVFNVSAGIAIYVGAGSTNTKVIRNNLTADNWITDDDSWIGDLQATPDNYYNTSTEGNIYYFANGTPSWQVFTTIYDNDANNYADIGSPLPFNSTNNVGYFAGAGEPFDYHPYTTNVRYGCANITAANTNYVMNVNETTTPTCFNITAVNVTLNCNGHSMNGTNESDSYGVHTSGLNTTVQNCIIANYSTEISSNANYGTFKNNTITHYNTNHGIISNALYVNITNNTITSYNGENGIQQNSRFGMISHNFVNSTHSVANTLGIYLAFSSNYNNTIENNTVYTKAGGLKFESSTVDNVIRYNYISNYIGGSAITLVTTTHRNIFYNNTIISNDTAINVDTNSANNTFYQNNITARVWATSANHSAYFNTTGIGNIYFFINDTPSWNVFDITASTGTWADGGAARPFNSSTVVGNFTGAGNPMDWHPYTTNISTSGTSFNVTAELLPADGNYINSVACSINATNTSNNVTANITVKFQNGMLQYLSYEYNLTNVQLPYSNPSIILGSSHYTIGDALRCQVNVTSGTTTVIANSSFVILKTTTTTSGTGTGGTTPITNDTNVTIIPPSTSFKDTINLFGQVIDISILKQTTPLGVSYYLLALLLLIIILIISFTSSGTLWGIMKILSGVILLLLIYIPFMPIQQIETTTTPSDFIDNLTNWFNTSFAWDSIIFWKINFAHLILLILLFFWLVAKADENDTRKKSMLPNIIIGTIVIFIFLTGKYLVMII